MKITSLVVSSIALGAILLTDYADQSYADDEPKRYKNLYGYEDFNSSMSDNLFGTVTGAANFLIRNEMYLRDQQPDEMPVRNSVYDFIVIGAGTAGATIASRLSEIEEAEVLLIEAGADETLLMDIPILAPFLQPVDEINWKYQTEPSDKYCLGMVGRRCNWPRGKVMGGSSVLNFMIATRGSPKDFDHWAELGNDGWAYKDVLKYFKKLENIQIPELRGDKYHGTNGPVAIGYAPYHTPVGKGFLEAGRELGYPLVDYNGEKMIGFSYIQSTIHNGYRVSSNRAYLSGKRRRNLHVAKMSMVSKILIDRKNNRAMGVRFTKNGQRLHVFAKKEVILSAGAIGSPQILMLSGIGPAQHLAKLGIGVVKDAPVGDNLMDHIAYGGLTFTVDQPVSVLTRDLMDFSKAYAKDYLLERKGPLTIPGGCAAISFLDVDDPKNRDGEPNIELLFMAGTVYEDPVFYEDFGFNEKIRREFADFQRRYGWGVFPMLLRPKSRGWIRLKSRDVNVKPKIVPNYLNDPEDIRLLVKGIRAALQVGKTKALQKFGTRLYNKTLPGCENHKYDSDNYWECHLRMMTLNIYHYSGTCKMGAVNDRTAVVDPTLKVIGVKGLRVADASIMPQIISAHPNIPTFMIAEKLADMVKNDWGYSTS